MKKIVKVLLVISIFLILVSFSTKSEQSKENQAPSTIDSFLVEQLNSEWIGDSDANYPAQGRKTITQKNGYVYFENEKLQIIETRADIIFTQTKEDNPLFYDFKINKNKLKVLPWHPVSKGKSGGDLKLLEYMRDDKK